MFSSGIQSNIKEGTDISENKLLSLLRTMSTSLANAVTKGFDFHLDFWVKFLILFLCTIASVSMLFSGEQIESQILLNLPVL